MAVNVNKVPIGHAVVSIGDYVSAGGAGSLTDVGLTMDPVEFQDSSEDFQPEFEQLQGPPLSTPLRKNVSIKVKFAEMDLDKLRRVFRQPTANLSGTEPNKTLVVDFDEEQYLQVQVVTKGIAGDTTGTRATRTITGWRGIIANRGAIPFGRGVVQNVEVEFNLMQDTSIAEGSGQFYTIADTGAA